MNRTILPIHAEVRQEVAEATANGQCEPGVECARIDAAKMDALYGLVKKATLVRHDKSYTSPHYGSRFITASFAGGRCEIGDSSIAKIVSEDRHIFYAAFDAIVATILASRDKKN